MTTAIRARNLGKHYQLGTRERGYTTFREALTRLARSPFERFRQLSGRASVDESFWALKDISFDIEEGEVVGIIGRNGAGKSTLLKILSQITEPTTGEVELHGRVGSLLEVGTGFHPELSGRENIYLNGAILGMKRTEITRRFEEIVAFAEVEKFLDTPVKRYSSGMYMRLAFAVAAHLEPEILVVDEVLAVGDAAFQKKCLGKIDEVAKGGRTVLLVSHNMGTVVGLCSTAIWLDGGKIRRIGRCRDVVERYATEASPLEADAEVRPNQRLRSSEAARITHISLRDAEGRAKFEFLVGEPFDIDLTYQGTTGCHGTGWVIINTAEGIPLLSSFMRDAAAPVSLAGAGRLRVRLGPLGFQPGRYTISAGIFSQGGDLADWCEHVLGFEVLKHFHDGRAFDFRLGMVTQTLPWTHVSCG